MHQIKREADGSTWLYCPICRRKLFKLRPKTRLVDFPAWCRRCKQEHIISLDAQEIFSQAGDKIAL